MSEGVEALRQPEYTGENRCRPCTAVNVALAAVVGAGVGLLAAALDAPVAAAVPAALAAFAAGLVVVYLRGYLVPGTPRLTRTYLPEPLFRALGKDPLPADDGGDAVAVGAGGIDPASALASRDPDGRLREAGVVTGGETPSLDPAFREDWTDATASLDGEAVREALARERSVDPGSVTVREGADRPDTASDPPLGRDPAQMVTVSVDGRSTGEWLSRAALLLDLGAAAALRSRLPWGRLDRETRERLCYGLRAFRESCPTCGGAIGVEREVVEQCCGGEAATFAVLACGGCGARIAEFRRRDVGDAPPAVESLALERIPVGGDGVDVDVRWSVSDPDGDLETVEIRLVDADGETAGHTRVAVDGDSASEPTRLVADAGVDPGDLRTRVTVRDSRGNADSASATLLDA